MYVVLLDYYYYCSSRTVAVSMTLKHTAKQSRYQSHQSCVKRIKCETRSEIEYSNHICMDKFMNPPQPTLIESWPKL